MFLKKTDEITVYLCAVFSFFEPIDRCSRNLAWTLFHRRPLHPRKF